MLLPLLTVWYVSSLCHLLRNCLMFPLVVLLILSLLLPAAVTGNVWFEQQNISEPFVLFFSLLNHLSLLSPGAVWLYLLMSRCTCVFPPQVVCMRLPPAAAEALEGTVQPRAAGPRVHGADVDLRLSCHVCIFVSNISSLIALFFPLPTKYLTP